MKNIVIGLLLLVSSNQLFGQKHTICGSLKDSETGELLPGATIAVKDKPIVTSSNSYGFYSLSLPDGNYSIVYSYLGYQKVTKEVSLTGNVKADISLSPAVQYINEVVVNAEKNKLDQQPGTHSLSAGLIKSIPSVGGEADVFKSLQLLPGVQTANEGTTNLCIRGGSYDQNLILLDEAPVYNPSHALGFFSTFNADAIKNVNLYKGYFPSRYGGRLSSVVDISMKEGNNQKLTYTGGVGLVASRLSVEGPIKPGKSSFIVSGRYSYAGETANKAIWLGRMTPLTIFNKMHDNNDVNFYDINAKANFNLDSANHLYLSAYTGHDHFYYLDIDNASTMDWGNTTATVRWNHIYNNRLFSNLTGFFSNYNYAYYLKDNTLDYRWTSNIRELCAKNDYDFYLDPKNHVTFGASLNYQLFHPGKIAPRNNTSVKTVELAAKNTVDASLYLNNEQKFSESLTLDYGLRYTAFFNLGGGTVYDYNADMTQVLDSTVYKRGQLIKFYHALEPRLSANFRFNNRNAVKLSYSRTSQFLHLLSNSSVGLPTDVWLPPDKYIKPQTANQLSLGYYHNLPEKGVEISLEAYYKQMNRVIDYVDNANLFLNSHIETQVKSGKGLSYGLEGMVEKTKGRLTGWISYTLSNTTHQIDGINDGNSFPARYDIRHNLSVTGNYQLNPKWTFSSVFRLTSGGHITMPQGLFNYQGAWFNYYSERNGYQLPMYHRLDISMTYRSPKNLTRKWKSEWVFGIYNVYGRKNLFSLFVKQNDYDMSYSNEAYKMYLFTIVPSVTYNFKF